MNYINGYALALFLLAKEEKKLSTYKDESHEILLALEGNEEYLALLNKKSLPLAERKDLVAKAFGKLEKNLVNFLFILVEKAKADMLVNILNKLIKLINESLKISEGVVYTPEKLTPEEITKISKQVALRLGLGKLDLINKIDKELVSGFKVVVADEIIEDSVVSRLQQIKAQLLERKEN